MNAVILAAGSGGRARPLTFDRPKPLFPIRDRPALGRQMQAVAELQPATICVNVHHHSEAIARVVDQYGTSMGLHTRIFREKEPLGAGGALWNMREALKGAPFLLANSDVVCDAPLSLLYASHVESGSAVTFLVVPGDEMGDFEVDRGRVVDLIDRRTERRPGWVYAGLAIFQPEVIDRIPEGVSGLFGTVIRPMFEDGTDMGSVEWNGYWKDIGTIKGYLEANLDAIGETSFVGPGASTEGVILSSSVIGGRAAVAKGSILTDCVVWDGATVPWGNYSRTIFSDSYIVRVS